MKKRRIMVGLISIALIMIVNSNCLQAKTEKSMIRELSENLDYEKDGFSLKDFVEDITKEGSGEDGSYLFGEKNKKKVVRYLFEQIKNQWDKQKKSMLKLLLLGIMAGLFSNCTMHLEKTELSEVGFFVVYLVLFANMSVSFAAAFSVSKEALNELLRFMTTLVPALCMSVWVTSGALTSSGFYEVSVLAMVAVDMVLVKLLLPAIQIYFLLGLTSQALKQPRFSKLTELLKKVIQWTIRTVLGFVVGLQGVQMLLYPGMDSMRKTSVWRAASNLPGVTGVFRNVVETMLGAGMLVKSAIGVGGIIGILVICLMPILKIVIFIVSYMVCQAVLQPMTEKRVIQGLEHAVDSGRLLLLSLACGSLMFSLSITLLLGVTGQVRY